jgi:hypothetical protein
MTREARRFVYEDDERENGRMDGSKISNFHWSCKKEVDDSWLPSMMTSFRLHVLRGCLRKVRCS